VVRFSMRFSLMFGEICEQMDVTWMDKPFHLLSPRVKAIVIALKYSSVGLNFEDD
jgi:hypothetical protein